MLKDWKIIFVLIYYLVFCAIFLSITPVYETPDEDLHLQYINYVSFYNTLPNQYEGIVNKEKFVGQGHQHPLYYIITGSLISLFKSDCRLIINPVPNHMHVWFGGTAGKVPEYNHINENIFGSSHDEHLFYLLRILSIIFGLINIIFIYKIARIIFSSAQSPAYWALFMAFFAASLPQYLFISVSVNNDMLANLFSTLSIYIIFKIFNDSENIRYYIILGITLGLGFLTKKTLLFLVPGFILAVIYLFFKKENLKNLLKYFSVSLAICFLICGWFFIRNYILYGGFLGSQMETDTMPYLVERESIFSKFLFVKFLPGMYHSFFASFGWMNVKQPLFSYALFSFVIILSLNGIILKLYKEKFKNVNFVFSLILFLICLVGIYYFNLTFKQTQGRYLFPVLSVISVLIVSGLIKTQSIIRTEKLKNLFPLIIIFILCFLDVVSVIVQINFYHNPGNYL
ncbi:DUF2142 domain-containing protein [bacterium]|nr:MAG: DUF2142 domain-containing protein [bacterium]